MAGLATLQNCSGSTADIQLRTGRTLLSEDDPIFLQTLTLNGLKAKSTTLGVKRSGAGWTTCCPPNGSKSDIIRAIVIATHEETDCAGSHGAAAEVVSAALSDRGLAAFTLEQLKQMAQRVGVKVAGAGWSTCCPPRGTREDIITAITAAAQQSINNAPPEAAVKAVNFSKDKTVKAKAADKKAAKDKAAKRKTAEEKAVKANAAAEKAAKDKAANKKTAAEKAAKIKTSVKMQAALAHDLVKIQLVAMRDQLAQALGADRSLKVLCSYNCFL